MQDHGQENKRRIQELAGELTSNSVMTNMVQQDVEDFVRKFDSLESEVSSLAQTIFYVLFSLFFLFPVNFVPNLLQNLNVIITGEIIIMVWTFLICL